LPVNEIKQTFWKFDYSDAPFLNYDTPKLENYIQSKIDKAGYGDKIRGFVRLELPAQDEYQVVGKTIPVDSKVSNTKCIFAAIYVIYRTLPER